MDNNKSKKKRSLFFWPEQIFQPGGGIDALMSVIIVAVGFVLSGLAIVADPIVAIVGFIAAHFASAWAVYDMDHRNPYFTTHASFMTNAAYMIGAIGWIFRVTTVVLGVIAIAQHFFFK